ncbi:hypothetical protein EV137_7874 [Kribbella pratensis]|uniref:DUF5605 domain-containing protein n=1 Tax=Kribbella pratensis TaxID=2512112 RepID=A0ABY2F5T7_9ACTN|nr:DUF5605 domain-containing protein [Kribbella pratensis]TDW81864.1 hypothetical protein EV137_7874 [Kribbella pratensis]
MTSVARWDVLELPVPAPAGVLFRHTSGATAYVEPFQSDDGWVVRYSPDLEGVWSYDGGTVECTPATSHGPVRRAGTTLRWADGTPYHPLTTTWFGDPAQWAAARPALAASPFNRVRLRVSDGIEDQVRDLLAADIVADIVLPTDSSVVRAAVNRLAAYRNVTWCLESADRSRELAELIAELDSSRHLISMHEATDPGPPWLTHLSVRLENLRGVSALRVAHAKPVFVDACGHEGNGTTPDTSLRPEEMLTRIWEGIVRGAYVTHGEWYVDPSSVSVVPWSDGGSRPTGVVARRLRLLREVLDELPAGVEPIDDYRDAPTLAVPGSYYLQYLGEHQFPDRTFSLPEGEYDVDVLDVWNHSVRRTRESVADAGTLTVRLPGTQYQAIQIRRAS